MPRITVYDRLPDRSFEGTNLDYCNGCLPATEEAHEQHEMVDFEVYHPDYAEWGDYACVTCGMQLGEEDN